PSLGQRTESVAGRSLAMHPHRYQPTSRATCRYRCEGAAELFPRPSAPLEPVTQDHFDDQAVRAGCETETHTEVELPLGPQVEVDHREELMLLVVRPVEVSDRP